ncbi:SAM14 protein, partial [Rhinopomastus cyanomelas]|nr:SAM14 protein [Rhinopomastus cyanomelas]
RVTLRRVTSSKSRKEKGSSHPSVGSRELLEGPSCPTGSPFLPFSWFSDSARGSGSLSPNTSASQHSAASEDSPPASSPPRLPGPPKGSHPYHSLSQSSDEFLEEPPGAATGWSCQQVGQWLQSLRLDQYVEGFSAHGVDGQRLLGLDGTKLKALGVGSPQDRVLLRRWLKELALAAGREPQAPAERPRERRKTRDQEQR